MNIVGKVWGQTSLLLKTPFVEIHHIVIKPNCRCSLHLHTVKNNSFYVCAGSLTIEVHKNSYALVDVTTLSKGQFTNVSPGEYHRFISGPNGAEVLEIYHPEPLSEDIVRKDHGGSIQQDSLDTGGRSESTGSYRYD
jgi:mannose-6-phosphate isomerase-like protein (cupin superfamily)